MRKLQPRYSMSYLPFRLCEKFLVGCVCSLLLCCLLFSYAPASWHDAIYAFWCEDLPGINGIARIYIYGVLFVTAITSVYARPPLGDSPLQAPQLFKYTLKHFFSYEGLMKLIARDNKWVNYTTIRVLRDLVILAWICCIIGFGGIYPPIIVGVGFFLLHGIVSGCIGTSHRWYVPVYSLLALMFANGNYEYSIDQYLYKLYGDEYIFAPIDYPSLLRSSFARKFILMAGISTLFFGAVTKYINGGFAWLDGNSLAYYVSSEENGRSKTLKDIMHKFPSFSLLLSLASIGLEAVAVVAPFVECSRAPILGSAALLHLGIWLTMWPNYFPQTACYAVGVAWFWENNNAIPTGLFVQTVTPQLFWLCWIATFIWVFLCFAAVFRIEYWPLTGIPMYSFYRDYSYSYKHLRDAEQAQYVANEHIESQYPNAIAWSNLWITLRLKNTDPVVLAEKQRRKEALKRSGVEATRQSVEKGGDTSSEREFVNLKSRVTSPYYAKDHGVITKQWRRTLHNIAALDMSSKPIGHIEHSTFTEYPGVKWLKAHVAHLRRYAVENNWQLPAWADQYGELQLRCKLKDGYVVLAKIPWNFEKQQHTTVRSSPQPSPVKEVKPASSKKKKAAVNDTPKKQASSSKKKVTSSKKKVTSSKKKKQA